MFCSNCGENLAEGVAFCPKCGTRIGGDVSASIQLASQPAQPAVTILPVSEMPKMKVIKSLRVLSIIGFIWFPLSIFGYYGVQDYDQVFSFTFIIFGYALAHAIVALVQGNKNKIKVMTVMAVLGIIWYVLSSICIFAFMYDVWETSQGWAVLGLGYAVAFSIVCFIKAKINPTLNVL
jgi:peptidoglycan/LPS O-acetylase OafA/YrhL